MPEAGQDPTTPSETRSFVEHRELLFSVVYGMIGTVADTEDVLQETWLAWSARSTSPDAEPVANPRGYLVRVAVNKALAQHETIRRRRETYPGPWLPEPLVTSDEDASEAAVTSEAVSVALLVVLETLSPLERTVFVLHDVFGYTHPEIAGILDRSPAAIRQLGHRAREHVQARRPRFRADRGVHRQVTERFVAAALGGDLQSLLDLLAPEVTMAVDGGGRTPGAPRREVRGREQVSRLITGLAERPGPEPPGEREVGFRQVNDDPGAVLFDGDSPFAVMVLDLSPDGDRIHHVYTVVNPDKLSHIER